MCPKAAFARITPSCPRAGHGSAPGPAPSLLACEFRRRPASASLYRRLSARHVACNAHALACTPPPLGGGTGLTQLPRHRTLSLRRRTHPPTPRSYLHSAAPQALPLRSVHSTAAPIGRRSRGDSRPGHAPPATHLIPGPLTTAPFRASQGSDLRALRTPYARQIHKSGRSRGLFTFLRLLMKALLDTHTYPRVTRT